MSLITTNQSLTLEQYLNGNKGISIPDASPFYIQMIDPVSGSITPLTFEDLEIYSIRLNINPSMINLNLAKIINRTQTMTGWIEEYWGEEIDTVTLQGSTAAFVIGGVSLFDVRNGSNAAFAYNANNGTSYRQPVNQALGVADIPSFFTDDYGLTSGRRNQTVSYRELKAVLSMIHNNGLTYDEYTGLVIARSVVHIGYEYGNFKGYFESIDVTEDSAAPFRYTYTITFKSEESQLNYLT
jgi:hypothetical protein